MRTTTGTARIGHQATALCAALVVSTLSSASAALGQTSGPPEAASAPTWSSAVVLELAEGFVPYVNDVPLMVGAGLRLGDVHEVWARAGYMPVGDDIGHGFGCAGYRGRAILSGSLTLTRGCSSTFGHAQIVRSPASTSPRDLPAWSY